MLIILLLIIIMVAIMMVISFLVGASRGDTGVYMYSCVHR